MNIKTEINYVMLRDGIHLYKASARQTLCDIDKVHKPTLPWAPADTICRECLAVVGELALMNGRAT